MPRLHLIVNEIEALPRKRKGLDFCSSLSGWRDLNPRPLRPERSALPSCATPRACRAIVAHPVGGFIRVSPPAPNHDRDQGWHPRASTMTKIARKRLDHDVTFMINAKRQE